MRGQMIEAKAALERVFGFSDFRPGQSEVLEAVLSGENILAVMPTGSGKSICYQLPAIMRQGLTIVVSPLIALMRDQVRQLRQRGIAAAALNSSNSGPDNFSIESGLRQRRYRLVYVAPERLARPDTPALLREAGANALAIDEAHCVSNWGHDFRPEYLDIGPAAHAIGDLQLIAVTATANPATRDDIIRKLFPAAPRIFVRSFDRPNLHLAMRRKLDPPRQIETTVQSHRGQNGIIYCGSRKGVEQLSRRLSAAGVPALPYHAGLDAHIRSAHQDEFLNCDGVVIVATIAFGMGIDKPNVRYVCHADLPQSIEAYYQEIGRAGRDGLPARTLTLFGEADILLRERQILRSVAAPERKRIEQCKLRELVVLCETPRCRRQTLLAAFGETSEPCGNCDICEGQWSFFNGAVAAQKLMSAIHRTSGRFFSGHLANILVGKPTESIRRYGHDLLPAFGIGKELQPAEWRSIFRQLHAEGLIAQDPEDRDRWICTEAGRAVLAGKASVTLRSETGSPERQVFDARKSLLAIEAARAEDQRITPTPFATEGTRRKLEARLGSLTAKQQRLFAALKSKRLEIARAEQRPAFVIFQDSALIEMAIDAPRTREELQRVRGVEAAKIQRYGAIFLDLIRRSEEF